MPPQPPQPPQPPSPSPSRSSSNLSNPTASTVIPTHSSPRPSNPTTQGLQPPAPIPDSPPSSLPLPLSASLLLTSLPRDASSALTQAVQDLDAVPLKGMCVGLSLFCSYFDSYLFCFVFLHPLCSAFRLICSSFLREIESSFFSISFFRDLETDFILQNESLVECKHPGHEQ